MGVQYSKILTVFLIVSLSMAAVMTVLSYSKPASAGKAESASPLKFG
jgi:hypothetical protein